MADSMRDSAKKYNVREEVSGPALAVAQKGSEFSVPNCGDFDTEMPKNPVRIFSGLDCGIQQVTSRTPVIFLFYTLFRPAELGTTLMMDQELLSQPNVFMLSLLEAIEDELAFYSQDKNGNFVYLSKSAEKVLNLPQDLWKGSTFHQVLSDAPCNQELIQSAVGPTASPAPAVKKRCEILDREGKRIKLEIWQIQIVYEGVPIGLSGIIRRLQEKAEESCSLTSDEEEAIVAKVATLTTVERQVIELVVDGHMNKRMAAELDVAVRTIESRRSRAMLKLGVDSLSQLVQLWVQVRRMESRKRTEIS